MQVIQFNGQQYPDVKACVGAQAEQFAVELQESHPKAQALHESKLKKVELLQTRQIPAMQTEQFTGQQYPAFKVYNGPHVLQLVSEVQLMHPVEQL